jgi:hypothetical protein
MALWEIANPVSSEEILALIHSGAEITGTLTLTIDSDDPWTIRAVEEAAAERGIVLTRLS